MRTYPTIYHCPASGRVALGSDSDLADVVATQIRCAGESAAYVYEVRWQGLEDSPIGREAHALARACARATRSDARRRLALEHIRAVAKCVAQTYKTDEKDALNTVVPS